MDIPQRRFPQEVIDAIVNRLRGDTAALKRCALTAMPFVHTSQKLLFHSVHLDRPHVARTLYWRLHEILSASPYLGSYIRELYILDSPSFAAAGNGQLTTSWMADHGAIEIASLLSMLPNLQYLVLSAFVGLDWKMIPETMGKTFLDALGSISGLRISNIKNLPLVQFQNFSRLRSLTLDNVHFDSDSQSGAVAAPRQGHLEFFQFSHNYHVGVRTLIQELLLPTSFLSITRLRRLSITGYSAGIFDTASMVIEASAATLEVLTLKMNTTMYVTLGPSFESFHLGMAPKLRHLSLGFVFMSFILEAEELRWLARNLARSQLAISADLESLDVRVRLLSVRDINGSFESILRNRVWADLDSALAAPRYSKLRRASFSIQGGWGAQGASESEREQLSTELARRMPLLSDKRVLILVAI